MDEMDEGAIQDIINQAVAAQNPAQLKSGAYEIDTVAMCADTFPERSFAFILTLMQQLAFLGLEGSYYLLSLFSDTTNWEILSENQKERLLPALERAYGNFSDWMSCF